MEIAVLGPGAVGGLLAALLCRAGFNVVCVGKEPSVKRISSEGLSVTSSVYGQFSARPAAEEVLSHSVDLLIVAVKSPFLLPSLERVDRRYVVDGVVLSLLNGLGHSTVIRSSLCSNLAVGTIGSLEADAAQGFIRHASLHPPRIEFASNTDIPINDLQLIADILTHAGVTTQLFNNEDEVTWRKLQRLDALASITAAFQVNLGQILRDDYLRRLLIECIEEAAMVARLQGITLDTAQTFRDIQALPQSLGTSMQRDIAHGRPSEVDAITGGVISLGRIHGLHLPTHKFLYDSIVSRVSEGN